MEPIRWKVSPVIDAHSHYRGDEPIPHYLENLAVVNHDRGVLQTCSVPPKEDGAAEKGYRYKFAGPFKIDRAGRFYVFGGLVHEVGKVAQGDGRYLAPQVAELRAHGFDGIKMMEGSPYRKNVLPQPLDDEYYRPFWDAAEERAMPITLHLANPLDCWQGDENPQLYRDAEPQEEYFRQAEAVLDAHPRLPINFAHFMFMGPDLPRLDGLFARYPEMRVDLAPGQEYLYYLSDDIPAARRFFIKWADRILYGTDVSDKNSRTLARAKAEQVRLFLEEDGPFPSPYAAALGKPDLAGSNGRVELEGMDLPLEVLEKVLRTNVEAWLGPTPRPLEEA